MQLGPGCLSSNAENRAAVGDSRVQPGDHVGAGRSGGPHTDPDLFAACTAVTFRRVRPSFVMTNKPVGEWCRLLSSFDKVAELRRPADQRQGQLLRFRTRIAASAAVILDII
jgi:hypothetical protein